jgi:hypothetical protein
MVLIIFFCLLLTLVVPLLFVLMETHRKKFDPQDDGFWTVARAIMGGCHIRWNPDPNPIVWFDAGVNQGRLHVYQRAGEINWWIEGRIYLQAPLHFAARLCSPPQAPLKNNLPDLKIVEDKEKDAEKKLASFSLECNNEARFQQCLGQEELRLQLKSFRDIVKLHDCEVLLANQVLVLRGCTNKNDPPGELIERFGPQLVNLMRDLSSSLSSFSDRNRINTLQSDECPASAISLKEDLWSCPECSMRMQRKAMELMKGCINPHCELSVDGIPLIVLEHGRPEITMKEIEDLDLSEIQFTELNEDPNTTT